MGIRTPSFYKDNCGCEAFIVIVRAFAMIISYLPVFVNYAEDHTDTITISSMIKQCTVCISEWRPHGYQTLQLSSLA